MCTNPLGSFVGSFWKILWSDHPQGPQSRFVGRATCRGIVGLELMCGYPRIHWIGVISYRRRGIQGHKGQNIVFREGRTKGIGEILELLH